MPPFSYPIPERRNIEFLKLVVSTRPIYSNAGTWPCLCRLESDGPSMLDGGEYWGTLTIPMIQRRVSSVPPPIFAHLAPYFFPSPLRHLNLSNLPYTAPLRNLCTQHTQWWHLSETEPDPNLILSMPFHFRFHLIHLFGSRHVVDQFRSPTDFNYLVELSVSRIFSKAPVFKFSMIIYVPRLLTIR